MNASYAFRAVDATGAKVKGEVDAASPAAVVELLRTRGLIALEVNLKGKSMELSLDRFARLKLDEIAMMSRQLATMISSGLSLLRALMVLEVQTENPRLKAAVVAVRQDIESGKSLSAALERHPKIFSPLYVSMVRAGETGGFLEDVLVRVSDHLDAQARLRRQVRSAMVYPAVVITVAFGVMAAMLMFIVPVFASVFKQFNATMPSLTQFTMSLSDTLRNDWYLIILGVGAIVMAFRRWKSSRSGRPVWDRAKLKAPLKIGSIVHKVALARWSRTLSSLVTAGVPMLEAIDVTGSTSGNAMVERAMAGVRTSVQGGGTIGAALGRESIFPPLVTNMVSVGEETGALETTLAKVADFYEEQVEAAVKALTSILEPAMILVVGGIVGFMVISMYLPLFHVYDAIR
jgi:type IV pilus assembly protein PilC